VTTAELSRFVDTFPSGRFLMALSFDGKRATIGLDQKFQMEEKR
jgi:hypothetical protein